MDTIVKKERFSIKEVSKIVDEEISTLRYWEGEFRDTISPKRNDGGTRFYSDEDIDDVRLVKFLLRNKELTHEGARKVLKNNKDKDAAVKEAKLLKHLRHVQEELKELVNAFNL
jgi:DNA-binding transcriptional MerR regulator